MSLDKSTLLNIQKMITFELLLVLYLFDANSDRDSEIEENRWHLILKVVIQCGLRDTYGLTDFAY